MDGNDTQKFLLAYWGGLVVPGPGRLKDDFPPLE